MPLYVSRKIIFSKGMVFWEMIMYSPGINQIVFSRGCIILWFLFQSWITTRSLQIWVKETIKVSSAKNIFVKIQIKYVWHLFKLPNLFCFISSSISTSRVVILPLLSILILLHLMFLFPGKSIITPNKFVVLWEKKISFF